MIMMATGGRLAALAWQEPGARSERDAAGAALGGRGERAEKADSAAPQPHIEGTSSYVIARCASGNVGSGDVARRDARRRGYDLTREGAEGKKANIRGLGPGTQCFLAQSWHRKEGGQVPY